jgi:sentrin-specific protease 8
MMNNADEINAIILDPLDAKKRPFIIFAINNNDQDVAGGSHWSLCVYSKPDNTFFHFDSSSYFNHMPCEQLINIMKKCLQVPSAEFQRVDCLQQNNSYDCGIYVLCHADLVCKTIMKSKSLKDVKKLNCKTVTTKRSELIGIIQSLIE